ncbi:hypothetical protein BX667DRAFT_508997 [Coemansia mojavensis]|nr:hypothetical protein BX667DRAFT_508997 [Coemansia mojavensis]
MGAALFVCFMLMREYMQVPRSPRRMYIFEKPVSMGILPENPRDDVSKMEVQLPFKRCTELPIPDSYWNLAQDTPAFVSIPQTTDIEIDESICVRVVVPAKTTQMPLKFAPFPGAPWDSILLDLIGQNTNISVPVPLEKTDHTSNFYRDKVHIYEADVVLRDVDVYRPQGYIEYRHAMWNAEGFLDPQPFNPERLIIRPDLQITVTDNEQLSPYSLHKYLDMPLCTEPNADGRWIPIERLPFDPQQVPPPDSHGLVWLPYKCRLQRIAYTDFAKCLAQKYPVVHWYGDSNTRRALKKVATLGKWCVDNPDSLVCKCNDNMEPFSEYGANHRLSAFDLDPEAGTTSMADPFSALPATKPRIVTFKWDGLTTRNAPPWADYFIPNFEQKLGHPMLAILGMTNWDTAFETHAFFANEADRLTDKINTTYALSNNQPPTDIVLRTGQYYCCTSDMDPYWKRRYSRLRNHYFDKTLIETFKNKLGHERRVMVWDVARITERRPYNLRRNDVLTCEANHVRSQLVEIENQVLMNALCNS